MVKIGWIRTTTDLEKQRLAKIFFAISLVFITISIAIPELIVNVVWAQAPFNVLFALAAGMAASLNYDVSLKRSIALVSISIGVFGLVVLYALSSHGLLL